MLVVWKAAWTCFLNFGVNVRVRVPWDCRLAQGQGYQNWCTSRGPLCGSTTKTWGWKWQGSRFSWPSHAAPCLHSFPFVERAKRCPAWASPSCLRQRTWLRGDSRCGLNSCMFPRMTFGRGSCRSRKHHLRPSQHLGAELGCPAFRPEFDPAIWRLVSGILMPGEVGGSGVGQNYLYVPGDDFLPR